MKLVFVSAHPAPYRDPFLRRLMMCSDINVRIFTLFADDNAHAFWDLNAHGYPLEVIGKRSEHWLILFLRLMRQVVFGGFDFIILPGFHRRCAKAAMFVCALLRKRFGFCADSIVQPSRGKMVMAIKRFVIRRAAMIFVPGIASRDFFVKEFNYPRECICLGQYALEGKTIEENVLRLRNEQKKELRNKYGISGGKIVFMMVANMITTRHYPITAEAFVRFAEHHPNSLFVMVGVGPELERMKDMARHFVSLKVIPGVSFSEMQELYAIADVYVHGGCEPASTALVIGAISHLPLISSMAVGCTADVVRKNESGVIVENHVSVDAWVNGFEEMMCNLPKWEVYGANARRLSEILDCENVIAKFCSIVTSYRRY